MKLWRCTQSILLTAVLGFPLLVCARAALAVPFGYCEEGVVHYPPCSSVPGYPTGYYLHGPITGSCCLLPQCADSGGLHEGTEYSGYDLMTNGFGSWCFINPGETPGQCCGEIIP